MRVLIVTDAWMPQVNGVVITLLNTIRELERLGHEVGTITPDIHRRLAGRGFANLAMWSRGVDTEMFRPAERGR